MHVLGVEGACLSRVPCCLGSLSSGSLIENREEEVMSWDGVPEVTLLLEVL